MPASTAELDHLVTRQRLLEAAGEAFAERGFRDATLRDICRRADANIAAVKYHFGDKEQLYAQAVQYAHQRATHHDVVGAVAAAKDLPSDRRLHAFVRAFLTGILEEGRPAWHAKLFAREIAEPTHVLDEIARQVVRPRLAALAGIIRDILGPNVPPALLQKCARSIVGQILFYHFARPMLERVFPDEPLDASAVDPLTDHITAFSLHALHGYAAELKSAPPKNRAKKRAKNRGRR
jgi:AcrR family transcriptional regulator